MEGAGRKQTKTSDTMRFHPYCREESRGQVKTEAVRLKHGKRVLARGFWKRKQKKNGPLNAAVVSSKAGLVVDLGDAKLLESAGHVVDLSSDDADMTVRKGGELVGSPADVILLSDDSDAEEDFQKGAEILLNIARDVIDLSDDGDDNEVDAQAAAFQLADLGGLRRTFDFAGPSFSLNIDGASEEP